MEVHNLDNATTVTGTTTTVEPITITNAPDLIVMAPSGRKTIFHRLQEVRKEFAMVDVKKTGKGYGYQYFELSDFLHVAQMKFAEHELCPIVTFPEPNKGVLTVYDSLMIDPPIIFNSPMAVPEMKGMNSAQAIGAAETYVRRYLYMAALEIAEHSAIEDDKAVKEIDTLKAEIGEVIASIKTIDLAKRPTIAKILKAHTGTAQYTSLAPGHEEVARKAKEELEALLDELTNNGGDAA